MSTHNEPTESIKAIIEKLAIQVDCMDNVLEREKDKGEEGTASPEAFEDSRAFQHSKISRNW